jgi:hypothetical protein
MNATRIEHVGFLIMDKDGLGGRVITTAQTRTEAVNTKKPGERIFRCVVVGGKVVEAVEAWP